MKILVLSTFPIDEPRHGGQIRVRNLYQRYKDLGHEVKIAGVLGSSAYNNSENFIDYPAEEIASYSINSYLMEDFIIGELLFANKKLYESLVKKILFSPDVIHVEHPWLYKFAEKFSSSLNKPVKIIYGSANIEYQLKKQILENYAPSEDVEKLVCLVKQTEEYAARNADVCLGVSKENCDWLQNLSNSPVYLIPNGVADRHRTKNGLIEFKKLNLEGKFALFCASGHPPNAHGFFEMFNSGLGSLSPDQRLVVVGGVSGLLLGDERFFKIANLAKRTSVIGEVSDDLLAELLFQAHCIILPISQGEGTNLKTAEALWTGCHIVGTPKAFRGFENYMSSSGVWISETPKEFRRNLRNAMSSRKNILSDRERRIRRSVLWTECLDPLADCLSYLEGNVNDK